MRMVALLFAVATVAFPVHARADKLTVGLFAPSAPFSSTAARVELATKLGDQLGTSLGGTGAGRVYARSGDFSAAVRAGDVKVALVDATYLASASGYVVIAVATRGSEASYDWQLITRGGAPIKQLRGKRLLVPSVGGKETDFVMNALFGGELPRDYFSKIESAIDTASALAALGLGKVDAVVVPAGIEPPPGTSVALKLRSLSGPLLVAYGNVTEKQRGLLATAANEFRGDGTVTAFRLADASEVQSIARRLTVAPKRGPFAVPAARLVVGDLIEGRRFSIERTPPTAFAILPGAR